MRMILQRMRARGSKRPTALHHLAQVVHEAAMLSRTHPLINQSVILFSHPALTTRWYSIRHPPILVVSMNMYTELASFV